MPLQFEITKRSFYIGIDEPRFLNLIDSESYVTDNAAYKDGHQTLLDKLDKLPGISRIEYDAHFGTAVYLDIDDEDDTPELRKQITDIIESHLAWCATLDVVPHVAKSRALTG